VTTHSTRELGVKPVVGQFSKYLNYQETAILVALFNSVRPRVAVEFGCHVGRTAKVVLDNVPTLERYIGIDVPADHVPTLACQMSEVSHAPGYEANDNRFHLLLAPSQSLTAANLEPVDAVFIDGDHSIASVLYESRLAKQLVRPGGIIVWHDWMNPAVEVVEALTVLKNQGWRIDDVENSWLAFMRISDDADEAAQGRNAKRVHEPVRARNDRHRRRQAPARTSGRDLR